VERCFFSWVYGVCAFVNPAARDASYCPSHFVINYLTRLIQYFTTAGRVVSRAILVRADRNGVRAHPHHSAFLFHRLQARPHSRRHGVLEFTHFLVTVLSFRDFLRHSERGKNDHFNTQN
jgi:hypothetical protein